MDTTQAYQRFWDDLRLVINDRERLRSWIWGFKAFAGPRFYLCVESMSRDEVATLAVDVVLRRDGSFATKPRRQELLGPPLSHTSNHPVHVYSAWPHGVMHKCARANSCSLISEALASYLKFSDNHVHHVLIPKLERRWLLS